jgi:DNA-binding PadR family transcriptional regulator
MSLEKRAQLLHAIAQNPCGVREIIQKLRWQPSFVISLLKKMNAEKLVEAEYTHTNKRGRPKKTVACTALGLEFLEDYKRLKMKPIRSKKEDLERATKDALYAKRLVAAGHSPFRLFMELNTFVHNIKISSEAS